MLTVMQVMAERYFCLKPSLKVVISYMIQLLFDQILKMLNIKSTFFTVCGKIRFHLSSSQLRFFCLFFNIEKTMQVILYRSNKQTPSQLKLLLDLYICSDKEARLFHRFLSLSGRNTQVLYLTCTLRQVTDSGASCSLL